MDRPLARRRLAVQGLSVRRWDDPVACVRDFGVMQGQEQTVFSSVALRTTGDIADVHRALDDGRLVRAYPMRGTVFLTTPEDLMWITQLCTSRASSLRAVQRSGAEIDDIDRLIDALPQRLNQGEFRELVARVIPGAARSTVYRLRLHLLVTGVLVYAGRDQQLTRAGGMLGPDLRDRDAATVDLLTRYLRTRGPATLDDFAWWSKLPKARIRRAAERLPADLVERDRRWAPAEPNGRARSVHLLPAFDEFILGYRDRLFTMTPETHTRLVPGNMGVFRKPVVVDGVVRGSWRRVNDKLVVDEYATVPAYAAPGIRRRYREFPFHPA